VTLATRGRWPRGIPWQRGCAVHLPPLGAHARAPPAPQWGPQNRPAPAGARSGRL